MRQEQGIYKEADGMNTLGFPSLLGAKLWTAVRLKAFGQRLETPTYNVARLSCVIRKNDCRQHFA